MEASCHWSITRLASFKNSSRLKEEEDGPPLSTFELAPPPTSRSVIAVSAPISPPFVVDSPSSPMETLGLPSAAARRHFQPEPRDPSLLFSIARSSVSQVSSMAVLLPPTIHCSVSIAVDQSLAVARRPAGSEQDEALVCENLERRIFSWVH
ncbi:UNVERIFIED_CONTAM: hypothetical protein Sindi_0077500 [Sesamum indicum]